ncbi:MAG: PDZ domain-containing protein [Phycisphaerales bacterium]|nr:PDZ domain-containing protein [Phycisphaerales bacterium]
MPRTMFYVGALMLVGVLCDTGLPAPQGAAQAPKVSQPSPSELSRRGLAERVNPSIVSVTTYIKVPDGVAYDGRWAVADESPISGYAREVVATGMVIDSAGTVICTRKPLLLEGGTFADKYDIETSSGSRYEVEVLGTEPTIDLAVLRVIASDGQALSDLVPATIGSVDRLQVGDDLFAVADPFGAARTFAPGIVMALPQVSCYQADLTGSFIHGSMSVCAGAAGGALVNRDGHVVGMIVPPPAADPLARPAPESFATYGMQIQTAVAVGEALKKKRSDVSPFLGFSVLSLPELKAMMRDDAKYDGIAKPPYGLYINDVFSPSPAVDAGVQVGDFVMEVNGTRIGGVPDFQQCLYYFAGTRVPVRIFRDGRELTPMIAIEARPAAANRM